MDEVRGRKTSVPSPYFPIKKVRIRIWSPMRAWMGHNIFEDTWERVCVCMQCVGFLKELKRCCCCCYTFNWLCENCSGVSTESVGFFLEGNKVRSVGEKGKRMETGSKESQRKWRKSGRKSAKERNRIAIKWRRWRKSQDADDLRRYVSGKSHFGLKNGSWLKPENLIF